MAPSRSVDNQKNGGTAVHGVEEHLCVFVRDARNLLAKDRETNSSDPFAVLKFDNNVKRTKVLGRNRHPYWAQRFFFSLREAPPSTELKVILYDQDIGKADFLGQVVLTMGEIKKKLGKDEEAPECYFSLQKRRPRDMVGGDICLGFRKVMVTQDQVLEQEALTDIPRWCQERMHLGVQVLVHGINNYKVSGLPKRVKKLTLSCRVRGRRFDLPLDVSNLSSTCGICDIPVEQEIIVPIRNVGVKDDIRKLFKTPGSEDELFNVGLSLRCQNKMHPTVAKTQVPFWDIPLDLNTPVGEEEVGMWRAGKTCSGLGQQGEKSSSPSAAMQSPFMATADLGDLRVNPLDPIPPGRQYPDSPSTLHGSDAVATVDPPPDDSKGDVEAVTDQHKSSGVRGKHYTRLMESLYATDVNLELSVTLKLVKLPFLDGVLDRCSWVKQLGRSHLSVDSPLDRIPSTSGSEWTDGISEVERPPEVPEESEDVGPSDDDLEDNVIEAVHSIPEPLETACLEVELHMKAKKLYHLLFGNQSHQFWHDISQKIKLEDMAVGEWEGEEEGQGQRGLKRSISYVKKLNLIMMGPTKVKVQEVHMVLQFHPGSFMSEIKVETCQVPMSDKFHVLVQMYGVSRGKNKSVLRVTMQVVFVKYVAWPLKAQVQKGAEKDAKDFYNGVFLESLRQHEVHHKPKLLRRLSIKQAPLLRRRQSQIDTAMMEADDNRRSGQESAPISVPGVPTDGGGVVSSHELAPKSGPLAPADRGSLVPGLLCAILAVLVVLLLLLYTSQRALMMEMKAIRTMITSGEVCRTDWQ